ncbi:DUF2235 domain-containing protein [Alphaproteobacteria bacterium KMM 3653]|uniref:DUF2235 domain-containing protein n=1 Tax=Harenicola maris TaxID=2841044 RepID=A0AAP2CL24_9RHOB|nr:DUF2235 domain-containing protein [Harenicola maris]
MPDSMSGYGGCEDSATLSDYGESVEDQDYTGGTSYISLPPDYSGTDPEPDEDEEYTTMPVQPCPLKDKAKQRPPITIRAGMYFDGTGNNKSNIKIRKEQERIDSGEAEDYAGRQTIPDKHMDYLASYYADFSNVARMERFAKPYEGVDASIIIYTEGMGTTNAGADDVIGSGLGQGRTGIPARVKSARQLLFFRIISASEKEGRLISRIDYDSFGFSRGAASAIHFQYMAHEDPKNNIPLKAAPYCVGGATHKVNFMGLYDTVAAYGGFAHFNDAYQLGFSVRDKATYIVHLAAGEENRANFSLSQLSGGPDCANGVEIFLPGVHSDVGGGYNPAEPEAKRCMYWNYSHEYTHFKPSVPPDFIADKNWFVSQGWYREAELETKFRTRTYKDDEGNKSYRDFYLLYSKRDQVRGEYAAIPFQLMVEFAQPYDVRFRPRHLKHKQTRVIPKLAQLHSDLRSYAYKTQSGAITSKPTDWLHRVDPAYKKLRHEFLHYSAHYDLPTVIAGYDFFKAPVSLMKPKLENPGTARIKRTRTYY